jgi:hypothetical protein
LASRSPASTEHRHLDRAEPVPHRLLHTGTGVPQRRGQAGRRVAAPVLDVGGVGRERGEERLGQPPLEERVHPVALDGGRQVVVALPACRSLGAALYARVHAEQHERLHCRRPGESGEEAQTGAHRVPDVDARTGGVGDGLGPAPQVGGHGG